MSNTFKKIALAVVLSSSLGVANAAFIQWDVPQDVSGDADVITKGSFIDSITANPSNLTVNGVTFNSVSNSTISLSNVGLASDTKGTSEQAGDYKQFLEVGMGTAFSELEMTLNGLSVGNTYLVQFWTPEWDINWITTFNDGNGNSTADVNLGLSGSNEPQFVIGSFVADATTQSIFADASSTPSGSNAGNEWAVFSGMQVRETAIAASVPEPQTYAMFLAGLGLLGFSARKKHS